MSFVIEGNVICRNTGNILLQGEDKKGSEAKAYIKVEL